jgi:hypothetical protein
MYSCKRRCFAVSIANDLEIEILNDDATNEIVLRFPTMFSYAAHSLTMATGVSALFQKFRFVEARLHR